MRGILNIWHAIVDWFEHGDLVPLIVVVSAVHYSAILQGHDNFVTATAIGVMVDLGHFRWVRAAVRYGGEKRWERASRWALAIFMTLVAFAYQHRFYQDFWLSVPLPLLIASLAWLNQVDGTARARKQSITVFEPLASKPEAPKLEAPKPALLGESFSCGKCERSFPTRQALAGHMVAHRKEA